MRSRTAAINIRVTPAEKARMERSARRCGLSVSAYLRELGFGNRVQADCSQELHDAYHQLNQLMAQWKTLPLADVDLCLAKLSNSILLAHHGMGTADAR